MVGFRFPQPFFIGGLDLGDKIKFAARLNTPQAIYEAQIIRFSTGLIQRSKAPRSKLEQFGALVPPWRLATRSFAVYNKAQSTNHFYMAYIILAPTHFSGVDMRTLPLSERDI